MVECRTVNPLVPGSSPGRGANFMYSIVIPYLSRSKYIDACKHYLQVNSKYPYELVEIVDETDVYYAFNYGVYKAKYDRVILLNDDMVVSKNWDEHFVDNIKEDTYVTCNVVEHVLTGGIIRPITNIHIQNLVHDCGDNIDNFDYNKFQTFVDSQNQPTVMHGSKGWYMPFGVHRKSFISYPNRIKFPLYENDVILIDMILPHLGYKFVKVNSFVYHFQRKSHSPDS